MAPDEPSAIGEEDDDPTPIDGPPPAEPGLGPTADEDPSPPLGGFLRDASPDGDFMAQQSFHRLQSSLFGRPTDRVRVGRYVIEQYVGSGGSGVVYRAFDPKHDRHVALKLLSTGQGRGYEAARDRLLREAQTLAKLSHPNVVRIHDVGTYDPAIFDPDANARIDNAPSAPRATTPRSPGVYLAMEFLDGSDLEQWLAETPRDWETVRDVFLAAGRGLAAAHARGLIHRDFKPANVSIDADGHVRVLDFGLARPMGKHISDPSQPMTEGAQQRLAALARPLDATLTAPGTLLGTPAYMAPEQHDLQRATSLSDQYAFCLALYEAWYGHRPFMADNEQALRRLKREGAVTPPPSLSEVPPHLFEVLVRGLSPEPDERFASMDALLQALVAPPPRVRPARSRRWPRLAVALGGVGLIAGAGAWWLHGRAPACDRTAWSHGWNETTQRAWSQRSAEGSTAWEANVAERIGSELQAQHDAGTRMQARRCEADPAWSEAVHACLDRRARQFAALVRTAQDARGPALVRLAEQLPRWPGPDECLEVQTEADARVLRALDRARLLEAQGDRASAREHAQVAYDASREDDPQRSVVAGTLLGRLALATGELAVAESALAEALWSARSTGRDDLAALAAIELLELARRAPTRPADATLWIREARERAAMPSVPIQARLRLYLGLARLALRDDDPGRARSDLDRALALPLTEVEPTWVLRARRTMAEALEREGSTAQAQRLRQRARSDALAHLGEGHPDLADDER